MGNFSHQSEQGKSEGWKLRLAYSPETPNLGQNRQFLELCDLENLTDDLEQGKSEGFDSCDRPSNLAQIWSKSVIFSCDQAALQMVFSVRLSVTPFRLCSHHRIIMKFSGVITNDQRKVHAKGQGQRSKVKVTEVTTLLIRFRTVTPVWIHIWWWNDAYSLMLLRRGALLFLKVIHQIFKDNVQNDAQIMYPDCQFHCFLHKASIEEVPYFSRSLNGNIEFDPNWAFPDCNSSLNSPMMAMKCCTSLKQQRRDALCSSIPRSSIKFQGHTAKTSPILTQIGRFRTKLWNRFALVLEIWWMTLE